MLLLTNMLKELQTLANTPTLSTRKITNMARLCNRIYTEIMECGHTPTRRNAHSTLVTTLRKLGEDHPSNIPSSRIVAQSTDQQSVLFLSGSYWTCRNASRFI